MVRGSRAPQEGSSETRAEHEVRLPDLGDLKGLADQTVTDLGAYLREQRQSAQLSLRQLADLAGVSNPYLSQVERGLRKPSAEVLQQIARGLRISAEVLYVRAGILDPSATPPTVEEAIAADEHLTSRQRKVLLDLYRTFRAESATDTRATKPKPKNASTPRRTS